MTTSGPQQLPPPGWYTDPADTTQERFWEGQQWSRQVRPVPPPDPWSRAGSEAAPPTASATSAPSDPYAQSGYAHQPWAPSAGATPGDVAPPQYPGAQPGYAMVPVPMTPDGFKLAGWGWRFLAMLIDGVAFNLVYNLITAGYQADIQGQLDTYIEALTRAIQSGGAVPSLTEHGLTTPLIVLTLVSISLIMLYSTVMLRWRGATLGMMAVGLAVVPVDEGAKHRGLGWRQSIIRSLAWSLISQSGVLFPVQLIGGLMPLWDKRRQSLWDKIAKTQVVRLR